MPFFFRQSLLYLLQLDRVDFDVDVYSDDRKLNLQYTKNESSQALCWRKFRHFTVKLHGQPILASAVRPPVQQPPRRQSFLHHFIEGKFLTSV